MCKTQPSTKKSSNTQWSTQTTCLIITARSNKFPRARELKKTTHFTRVGIQLLRYSAIEDSDSLTHSKLVSRIPAQPTVTMRLHRLEVNPSSLWSKTHRQRSTTAKSRCRPSMRAAVDRKAQMPADISLPRETPKTHQLARKWSSRLWVRPSSQGLPRYSSSNMHSSRSEQMLSKAVEGPLSGRGRHGSHKICTSWRSKARQRP